MGPVIRDYRYMHVQATCHYASNIHVLVPQELRLWESNLRCEIRTVQVGNHKR